MEEPKPKMGRPTKYDPKFCEELVAHMARGKSFETFAAKLGFSKDTLYQWVKKYPEFSDAKKRGTVQSFDKWEDLGHRLAEEGNAAVYIFNMKNRFGWRDKMEHSMDERKPIVLAYKTSKSGD